MPFPLQSFGPHIEDILGYASQMLELLDEKRFLYVVLVFYIVIYVARWAIGRVQNPPKLG